MPGSYGKGVLVTPTIHGNLMIGPSAADVEDKEAVNTTAMAMEEVMNKARRSINNLPLHGIITSFSGLRAHEEKDDFIIGEADAAPGFIDVAGMESPGLSCAPAIGKLVSEIIIQRIPAEKKHNYISTRKGIHPIMELSLEERRNLYQKNSAYANVICRCETITEGEILEAIHRPLGARTLDQIKRRTRAGSGRCQSGFCTPKIMELLARELSVSIEDITKFGGGSKLMVGRNKEIGETKG
jgi:glycerol-3-phosphate dehydrogenase